MKNNNRGQILLGVAVALVVLTIAVMALVSWLGNDMKWSIKQQKSTDAINLAEAAVNRAQWKLQSSTSTWAAAAAGTALTGYNFDTTYNDISGGTYRVKISSAANACVTIVGEGRDNSTKETRAISAVFKNQTIYSAIMSGSNVSWGPGLGVYWGPIMSQGNIALTDDAVAQVGFPRKLAGGVVTGTADYPRDTNGLSPPNTDNVEWWSDYQGVPPVPILDFATLRSSAATATGTLNVYGCANSSPVGTWDLRGSCSSTGNHNTHFGDSTNYIATVLNDPTHSKDYIWYWDGDVTLSGAGYWGNQATALRGTIIVRGNLTIDSSGDLIYNGHVPANAWVDQEEQLAATYSGGVQTSPATFDTGNTGEYPADTGFHQSASTWNFGPSGSWCQPGQGCGWSNTVGIKGFVYVGGNLIINNFLDINGAVWVNGSVTANYASANSFCGIMYDDTLQVPTLNVILLRQSWQEVSPSSTPWN